MVAAWPADSSACWTSCATISAVPAMVPTRIVISTPTRSTSSPAPYYTCLLWKYNASTVGRKRDIVHLDDSERPEMRAEAAPNEQESRAETEYLTLLGERVRETRARRGMTRKLLARDSGVSERYLAQLESGQGNISILLLRQIASALDMPIETLVHEHPDPSVDLAHAVELLRRLGPDELVEARQLLLQRFDTAAE